MKQTGRAGFVEWPVCAAHTGLGPTRSTLGPGEQLSDGEGEFGHLLLPAFHEGTVRSVWHVQDRLSGLAFAQQKVDAVHSS
ncbi:hypothetical protein [Streptomyces sp. NPDC059788]|uniref:hypothetical protein n=1 Tax=Streptomyces sp. NPDC059788 TaxID=3346948 RepID=UPI0036603CB8